MQLITERNLYSVSPQAFVTDGTSVGRLSVADPSLFRVGQLVDLLSTTKPSKRFKVNRIFGNFIFLGGEISHVTNRVDLSQYLVADNAIIYAAEQSRPSVPEQHIERNTYEEEPVVARRVVLVNKFGERVDTEHPLPVQLSDGSINIGTVNAELEVQLSHQDNVPNIGDVADSVRIGDGTDELAINTDGSINVVVAGSTAANPLLHKQSATFIDTTETVVATYATPVPNVNVVHATCDATTFGAWRIYIGSVAPANLAIVHRTSEFYRTAKIDFKQPEKVVTMATNIIVTFQANRYNTSLLGVIAPTFVRLEANY